MKQKVTIGRKDFIDIPAAGLTKVKCKIDTGADSCSIHATRIKEVKVDGSMVLRCNLSPQVQLEFTSFKVKQVKSSNGIPQTRYKVPMSIMLMGKQFNTEFTLTNRSKMTYPVLLGKNLLRGNFVVDVAKSNLSLQK